MAALPPLRRLLIEDFKDQQKWIGPLLLVLNNFFEAVVGALTNQLTIAANTTGDIKQMTLSGAWPVSVAWTKAVTPNAVLVGNCAPLSVSGSTAPAPSAAVGVVWQMSDDGGSLQVTSVYGITPSGTAQYTLTLVCLAG